MIELKLKKRNFKETRTKNAQLKWVYWKSM